MQVLTMLASYMEREVQIWRWKILIWKL